MYVLPDIQAVLPALVLNKISLLLHQAEAATPSNRGASSVVGLNLQPDNLEAQCERVVPNQKQGTRG